ncbi:sarcosine oxidase subunit gamma [uncultured Alsobacter sp.]|uniref:sarcosine oxidase subunit gamma n=1 Tax=uncultured Alsobacter sp. TaxID=1748258 RepID=UPI0025D55B1E|nr:sarcosine oxidase subunit gamma family protein [uncultured Alsobacter sp.]
MAEHITFSRRGAFAGLALPGRFGQAEGPAGLTVAVRTTVAIAQVVARPGRTDEVSSAVAAAMGLTLPAPLRVSAAGPVVAAWTGPGRWLVMQDEAGSGPYPAGSFVGRVAEACRGAASVTDQTDAQGVLRLSGPRTRDVLAKGLALDLHPRAFRAGMAASTLCGMVEVTLWQTDDTPTYDVAVMRGYAGSFWHWLGESAAEYGLVVAPQDDARAGAG